MWRDRWRDTLATRATRAGSQRSSGHSRTQIPVHDYILQTFNKKIYSKWKIISEGFEVLAVGAVMNCMLVTCGMWEACGGPGGTVIILVIRHSSERERTELASHHPRRTLRHCPAA